MFQTWWFFNLTGSLYQGRDLYVIITVSYNTPFVIKTLPLIVKAWLPRLCCDRSLNVVDRNSTPLILLQSVPKNTEPCIEYAKYHIYVNIAKWKVHGLLHMTFCHTLSKFCLKILISLQIIVNFKNATENPFLHDIDIFFMPCE